MIPFGRCMPRSLSASGARLPFRLRRAGYKSSYLDRWRGWQEKKKIINAVTLTRAAGTQKEPDGEAGRYLSTREGIMYTWRRVAGG